MLALMLVTRLIKEMQYSAPLPPSITARFPTQKGPQASGVGLLCQCSATAHRWTRRGQGDWSLSTRKRGWEIKRL